MMEALRGIHGISIRNSGEPRFNQSGQTHSPPPVQPSGSLFLLFSFLERLPFQPPGVHFFFSLLEPSSCSASYWSPHSDQSSASVFDRISLCVLELSVHNSVHNFLCFECTPPP